MEKKYEITLFGATGFTGSLTAEYLAKECAEKKHRLAIAGRNELKLKSLQKRLLALYPTLSLDVIYADSLQPRTLLEMALASKVVVTTVGPYLKYGDPLVKACIDGGAHYLDITGEGRFVENMVRLYHKQAKEKQVKIINCCGYDSIPSDMGVFYAVQELEDRSKVEVTCMIQVESDPADPFAAWKSISGGTWASAIGIMQESEWERREGFITYIKSTASPRNVNAMPLNFYYRELNHWIGVPLPFVDVEVVLRSAAFYNEYGENFTYGHFAGVEKIPSLIFGALGVGILYGLSQFGVTRKILLSLKESGEGPNEKIRETNRFLNSILVETQREKVLVEVRGKDPGYGDTSKMLAECALSLVEDETPQNYGVITTAIGIGKPLIPRLEKAGIRFTKTKL